MLHIILFILKLIGIVLALILGIFIFLLLVVLLVPIRYRMNAGNIKEVHAVANVSWLFRLLYLRISYIESQFAIKLYIFGRLFYDSTKPKESVKKEAKRITKHVGKKVEKKVGKKVEKQVKEQVTDLDEKQIDEQAEPRIRKRVEEKVIGEDPEESLGESKNEKIEHKRKKKENIFIKLREILQKLKEILQKIKALLLGIKDTIIRIKNRIQGIKELYNKYKSFVQNEINKAGLKSIFRSLLKILKHIRPTKLRVELEFGTGDPCSTGQALGVLAVFYGYYGEAIKIMPNFEVEILEGTLFCVGRIRLFTLLIICIKLILDKNFRQVIKNFRAFKEEL